MPILRALFVCEQQAKRDLADMMCAPQPRDTELTMSMVDMARWVVWTMNKGIEENRDDIRRRGVEHPKQLPMCFTFADSIKNCTWFSTVIAHISSEIAPHTNVPHLLTAVFRFFDVLASSDYVIPTTAVIMVTLAALCLLQKVMSDYPLGPVTIAKCVGIEPERFLSCESFLCHVYIRSCNNIMLQHYTHYTAFENAIRAHSDVNAAKELRAITAQ